MITIITLAKDDLAGLQRTYESLHGSLKYFNWVAVTPNDGSETFEYCKKLEGEGIISKVYLDDGTGIYAAMNTPIVEVADEDWIWYLNSGDEAIFESNFVEILEAESNIGIDWFYGGHYLVSESNITLGYRPPPQKFNPLNQLFAKSYVSHQATFIRGRLLKKLGGFDLQYKIAADWDLLVRANCISSPGVLNAPVATFHLGGQSTKLRNVGNIELFILRKKHLPSKYLLRSLIWFAYRSLRNRGVLIAEDFFPQALDRYRSMRMDIG